MKKKILLFLSLILIFSSISCTNSVEPSKEIINENVYDGSYTVTDKTIYTGFSNDDFEAEFTYKDEYFKNSSLIQNDELADISLIKALASTCSEKINTNYYDIIVDFHKKCQYDNFYISEAYKEKPTTDSIGYIISSKNVKFGEDNYFLISIAIRGFKYGAEWSSNFKLGESGNHQGFDEASNMILNDFKDYINKYNTKNNKIKLWISGYSRAGAVSGLLGTKISDLKLVDDENIYDYTFEAPNSMLKNDKEYNFIYNYVNPLDLITYMVVDELNLIKPGKIINYTEGKDINKVIEFAKGLKVNLEKYDGDNPVDSVKKIVSLLFSGFSDKRVEYTQGYAESIRYIVEILFSGDYSQIQGLFGYYKDHLLNKVVSILNITGLKKFVKDGLYSLNYQYDNEKLDKAIENIFELLTVKILPNVYLTDMISFIKNINAIIPNHFCEVTLGYFRA